MPASADPSPATTTRSTLPDFGFGELEAELCDVARRFLADQLPITRLRELVAADHDSVYDKGEPTTWDPGLWERAVELGWTAVAVPEKAGGTPVSMAGLAGLVEAAGASALPSPLLATITTTLVLNECVHGQADPWLAAIAEGSTASLATTPPSGSWRPGDCAVDAVADGDGYRLTGAAAFVQDAAKIDLFVVQYSVGSVSGLAVVPRDADGLTIEADHIHDLTRDQATVHLDSVPVERPAVVSTAAADTLHAAWPGVLAMASADLCGVAEWLLQTTVEYAKERVQFDRPIGFFQAVKHPLVDVMIDVDRARSLLYHAASLAQTRSPGAETAARMAKSAASDAASFAADRAVQLHGGIGFTWEHDAHIYFKRALHGQALYGDGPYQRRVLADLMIGPVGSAQA